MAMLSRAVDKHIASSKAPKPLQSNGFAINASRPPVSNKRKFDRTMSNTSTLGALHEQISFNENDYQDVVDLTSPIKLTKKGVHYASLDEVEYPELPPLPKNQTQAPSSSAPVPWSSSPPSHFAKRPSHIVPSPEEARAVKRTRLPWVKADEPESTPQAQAKAGSKYAWDKSYTTVKDDLKELRRRNTANVRGTKASTDSKIDAKPIAATFLSDEQKAVVKTVIDEGKSVFFTGSAGTGKSVLMRAIISRLREKYRKEQDRIAITASTGLAACVIEGQTLHSWAGIGLGKEPAPELVKKIKRNAKAKTKWLRTKVLIVDEVSMVDGELFDKLEQIARQIRNNGRPFGGIQLVVTGDFFQLPPVPERNSVAKFAFDAATWNTCIEHTILLTHVFRQKDPEFASMLNEMRLGKLSPTSVRAFQKLSRPLDFHDDVEATELFPTRGEVDNANVSRMKQLSGQAMTFAAVDTGTLDLQVRNKILANFMAPGSLTLKKGAQVMLIKNIDGGLVNGSLGKVHAFMTEDLWTYHKDEEHNFKLAHEPEGGSDEEEKAAARLKLAGFKNKGNGEGPSKYWPMVRFAMPDGTWRDMLCQPEEWKTESQQGEIVAKRTQVPLILAWALSIHKAQGQTLSRVKVDLGRVFERGQAYVALSRATSQAGLQVLRFDQKKVMVHPKVINFYTKLVSIESMIGSKAAVKDEDQALDEEDEYENTHDAHF